EAGAVELLGIAKSLKAVEKADLLFWVLDESVDFSGEEIELLRGIQKRDVDVVVIANKADLVADEDARRKKVRNLLGGQIEYLPVSAVGGGDEREKILAEVRRRVEGLGGGNEVVISQARHHESFSRTSNSLQKACDAAISGLSAEFTALGLREALTEVEGVLGERFDEQVIDRIFKEFCLGK
ncbi:MAG: hypothetical protein C5B49_00340, partial [Bdellovibrio sp.]